MSLRMMVALLLLVLVLVPLLGFAAYLTTLQTRFILPARVNAVEKPADSLQPHYIALPTPDGNTLHGILYRPADGQPVTGLILAFPGNTHNPIGFATWLRTSVVTSPSVAIAAFSYRGYPNGITPPSSGTPSQKAMYEDSLLVYDTLADRLKPAHVKAVGYSIGTAVAANLATRRHLDALVLVAPLASVRRIVREHYPWLPVRLLLRHPFATEDIFARLTVPTTVIYSPTDGLIPERHITEILHNASPTVPLVAVPNTTHNTLILAPELPRLLQNALGKE